MCFEHSEICLFQSKSLPPFVAFDCLSSKNNLYGHLLEITTGVRELSFFSSRGGCGRNGMKDSVKFLIPPGSSRKIFDPPSLFVKISCDPPLKPPPPKVCWVFNDVVPTCNGHCPCQLGVWGCCKVPRAEP